MEYVEIINNGLCYPSIVNELSNRILFNVRYPNNNMTPRDGDVGYVINVDTEDIRFRGKTLKTVSCTDGYDYVMDAAGLASISEEEYNASVLNPTVKSKPKVKSANMPIAVDTIKIGDIIECIDPAAGGYGKQWKVNLLNSIGYDLLVGKIDSKISTYGYKLRQVKKVMPESVVPDENKPQFSKRELLDVLNQEKSAEEIILDLMDHITN